jgi:mono/diheme cytochrome c family protein
MARARIHTRAAAARSAHDGQWNRGAYLANAVAHCGECHTPRDLLGGLEADRRFAGAPVEGTDKVAPNISADPAHGIGKWSDAELAAVLTTGMKPNGDFVGAPMAEVVDGTSKLTEADRRAIVTYIKSVPPPR